MNYTQREWAKLAFEEQFPLVRASSLSIRDSFMQFAPNTETQILLMESLTAQMQKGLTDFRRAAIDPSVDENGKIIYLPEREPALGIMPEKWEQKAKDFMPEKNSRIGADQDYDVFLGTILKYLVEKRNLPVTMAWAEVCFSSELLGNTANSTIPGTNGMENTGSRRIGLWADLGNVQKIVRDGRTSEYLCRGCTYKTRSPYYSLASKCKAIPRLDLTEETMAKNAVPWIIMDA